MVHHQHHLQHWNPPAELLNGQYMLQHAVIMNEPHKSTPVGKDLEEQCLESQRDQLPQ